jgi:hypothetical protein
VDQHEGSTLTQFCGVCDGDMKEKKNDSDVVLIHIIG